MSNAAGRSQRWALVQELFHEALGRQASDRTAFLDDACGDDAGLRTEVESLLSHANAGVLGEPDDAPHLLGLEAERFGAYRILRPLGQGGMGSVYLAEREGSGFTQLVALKLIRAGFLIPPRLMPAIDQRFARERQILARLEHPGIARLIDGGYTPSQQPYLAMEFVEGLPLMEYARQHELGIRARLDLFQAVCDAVQYAHRQLVIHRDLKPSNILVQGNGQPKLLDFGIATFAEVEGAETDQPTGTRTGLWLTPNYASPEQVRRDRVTTLSDIYSLGVILYELLADVRPYEAGELSPGELEEIVCRRIPERPSARVANPRLARRLRGDLDTIVLKALAKEPERRYGSAQELQEDVGRHVRREPVRARPDSIGYRTTTFLRRNRSPVAAGVIVFVALLAGLATTTWQARTAQRARARAEAAQAESDEVADFLIGLFQESSPDQAPVDRELAAAILERGVARADELADQPAVRARLLDALGMIFLNMGRYAEARDLVGQALALRLGTTGTDHPDVALSLAHLGRIRRYQGEYAESEALLRHALGIQQRVLGPDDAQAAETMSDLAFVLPYLGRSPEAEVLYREVLALRRRVLGPDALSVGDALNRVAAILRLQGLTAQAESVSREELAHRERTLGPDDPKLGGAMISLADFVAEDSTRWGEAEALYREGLRIQRGALGSRHLTLTHGLGNLADLLARMGRYPEAITLMRELLELREDLLGPEHESLAGVKEAIADVLAAQGQLDEAIALRREGLATWRRIMGPGHAAVAGSLDGLARLYLKVGDDATAETLLLEALEIRRAAHGPGHALVGLLLVSLGELNTRRGHYEEAERQLVEGNAILGSQIAADHPEARRGRQALVDLYRAWGRPDKAADVLRSPSFSP